MQDILTTYLFQNKYCPLPSIGSLELIRQNAIVIAGEKKIHAPHATVRLSDTLYPYDDLLAYISEIRGVSLTNANEVLENYCRTLASLGEHEEQVMDFTGTFLVGADRKLKFVPFKLKHDFAPDVTAEKVIRQNDTHSILVGDTESTNTLMTEYYNDSSPASTDRWWIWAAAILLLSAVIITAYYQDSRHNSTSGNANSTSAKQSGKTYANGN